MRIEKDENKRTQAYLDLTYRIANEQLKGKWTYADAEDFFNELRRRKSCSFAQNGKEEELKQQEQMKTPGK